MKQINEIRFGQLSWPLKLAIVTAWANLTLFVIGFIIGWFGIV